MSELNLCMSELNLSEPSMSELNLSDYPTKPSMSELNLSDYTCSHLHLCLAPLEV